MKYCEKCEKIFNDEQLRCSSCNADLVQLEEETASLSDEQPEEMSGAKRTAVRLVSALAFFVLVALAVFGTDFITSLIKNLF